MIIIYKKLIINYINNKLSYEDISNYALSKNIHITNSDSIIIYNFIKRNYKFILNGDESSFLELKTKLNQDVYNKLLEEYMYYKNKL